MQDQVNATPIAQRRVPWNKGKLTGAKPPLRPKHVWSIRTKLQIEGRARDLAMFNLAIDSKLRGCDVVASAYVQEQIQIITIAIGKATAMVSAIVKVNARSGFTSGRTLSTDMSLTPPLG
jgi:hypothetical protein